VGVGLQYLSLTSEDSTAGSTAEVESSEMDLFAGTSYLGLGKVVPYGGLHLSMVDGEFTDTGYSADFEQDDSIGLFMGADMSLSDQFRGGAEVRLVSETSFSLNFSYLF
ncbi:MAG: hypothetical protein ACMUIS_11535, partial [bacterium]